MILDDDKLYDEASITVTLLLPLPVNSNDKAGLVAKQS